MAKVIHRLWKDGNNDLLIMPGSLPLYDGDTRNEMIYYLPPGWDPVVERDIDGDRAETTGIENRDTRFGSVQACRRVARTIFLGSAPGTPNRMIQGSRRNGFSSGASSPASRRASTATPSTASPTASTTSTAPRTATGSTPAPTSGARWKSARSVLTRRGRHPGDTGRRPEGRAEGHIRRHPHIHPERRYPRRSPSASSSSRPGLHTGRTASRWQRSLPPATSRTAATSPGTGRTASSSSLPAPRTSSSSPTTSARCLPGTRSSPTTRTSGSSSTI